MNNQLLIVSVICGVTVMGFVWFSWGLLDNLIHLVMPKSKGEGGDKGEKK
jgi:hypothetical protein